MFRGKPEQRTAPNGWRLTKLNGLTRSDTAAAGMIGLAFAWQELFLGADLGRAIWSPGDRPVGADLTWLVFAFDGVVALVFWLVVRSLASQRLRAAALGVCAGLLSGLLALSAISYRGRTLSSLWEEWQAPLTIASVVGTIAAAALLGVAERWVRSRDPRIHATRLAVSLACLAYLPLWISFAAFDAVHDSVSFPMASGLLISIPILLLAVGYRTRANWRLGSSIACVTSAVVLLSLPGLLYPGPPELPPRLPSPTSRAQPSVILLVLDTLRADHLGVYGYARDTSPNLDAFAARATVFEHAVSPSPWTVPSHASLMTGLYPSSHGTHLHSGTEEAKLRLPAGLDTLAERLHTAGYRTAGAVANSWLFAGNGFEQGFEAYFSAAPGNVSLAPIVVQLAVSLEHIRVLAGPARWVAALSASYMTSYLSLSVLGQAAGSWLEDAGEEPIFLFVNAMEAHDPFVPPPPYRDRWPGRLNARIPFHDLAKGAMAGSRPVPADVLEHLLSQYDGEILFLDHQLEQLFEMLRRQGRFDSSWIIVTSDHGEHFGEHGLIWHRNSLYDPLLHVPLIVKRPGQTTGQRVEKQVQLVDLMYTLLSRIGVPHPDRAEASDLWTGRFETFAELYHNQWLAKKCGPKWMLDLKSYEFAGVKIIAASDGAVEIYRPREDPRESPGPADSALAEEYRQRLQVFLERLPPPIDRASESREGIDPAIRDRLRGLGYVQ